MIGRTLFLLLSCLPFVAQAQPKAGDLKLEPYVFEAANKEKVDAELGRLLVPENRRNPNSKLIELAFVRFKSTSPNPARRLSISQAAPAARALRQRAAHAFRCFKRCAKSAM